MEGQTLPQPNDCSSLYQGTCLTVVVWSPPRGNSEVCLYLTGVLDKGMIHVQGGMGESTRFHRATQNGMQFKTYEFCISGIFHLIWGAFVA